MAYFICSKVIDEYLVASRFNKYGAKINSERYRQLLLLSEKNLPPAPWLRPLFEKDGVEYRDDVSINNFIIFKKKTEFGYGRVSYEITEKCNYKCRHCYLGQKKSSTISLIKKKKIIELIADSGCLWLQITGGEPLFDKDFPEIYNLAYSRNMLITISTNGSLLTQRPVSGLLRVKPPYRLTISVYGASKKSYETLTQKKGSFEKFLLGLDWAKKTGVRTRLNIIVTKYNEKEVEKMVSLAQKYDFEYFVFYSLSPTIYGDQAPIRHEAECQEIKNDQPDNGTYTPCQAGKTSFHVNSRGESSLCKAVREPVVDMIKNGKESFSQLRKIATSLFSEKKDCSFCEHRKQCETCPLLYQFFKRSGHVPLSICGKNK